LTFLASSMLRMACPLMQVRRYLKHENIDYEAPARAPPRYQQGEFDFEDGQYHPDGDPLAP